MKKYLSFIFLLFPQLLLAQAGGAGTEHGLRAGDELSREVVAFDGNGTNGRNVVWDLQEMEVLDNGYKTRYGGAEAVPWLVAGYEGLTQAITKKMDNLLRSAGSSIKSKSLWDYIAK